MLLDALDGFRATLGFADHADKAGFTQHHVGELVHPGGGGGACRANYFVTHRIDRANVIDEAVGEIDPFRQPFAIFQHVGDTLVGGVATGEDLAGEQHGITALPAGQLGLGDAIDVDAAHVATRFTGDLRPVAQFRRGQLGGP